MTDWNQARKLPPEQRPGADMLRQAADTVLGKFSDYRAVHVTPRGGVARLVKDGKATMFKLSTCNVGWKKRWSRLWGWNPARSAKRIAEALQAAGIAVCPIDDFGDIALPGAPRAVWTTGPWFDNAPALRIVRRDLQPDRHKAVHERVAELYRKGLQLARRLHDAGFEHRDFHAGNMLADGDELRLVDLETIRRGPAGLKARAKDIERYLENFLEQPDAQPETEAAVLIYAPDDADLRAAILAHPRITALIERISRGQRKKRPKPTAPNSPA